MAAQSKWRLTVLALGVIGAAALAVALLGPAESPKGVRLIAFGRESCAQCGMTISDPRFAAQLQTTAGDIYDFDDPGCLLSFLRQHHPEVRAIYFHAFDTDTWLNAEKVALVGGKQSPMGYGLGAVSEGTAGAMSLAEAQRYLQARRRKLHSAAPWAEH